MLAGEVPTPTWEESHDKPLHPDPDVASRMYEAYISNCEYGCKIYADPRSKVLILHHNSNYGCEK